MQRILIVDDERLVADTLGLIFRQGGFEAKIAYSADEALSCARMFSPELLLCDISMPGRDGVALMQDMAREHPGCRMLVLTGYHGNVKKVTDEFGLNPCPSAILFKPCQPSELLREAEAMLKKA